LTFGDDPAAKRRTFLKLLKSFPKSWICQATKTYKLENEQF
jgi:hypothetical protein